MAKLQERFDCSHSDALDFCAKEEDAEWLRRVRANLPASMGSRDVIYEKKVGKYLKRKAAEEERKEQAELKWKKEEKVRLICLF